MNGRWIRHSLVVSLAAAACAAVTLDAQQSPRELFERGRLLEENVRTLNRAVAVYEQVVAEAKNDRPLKAAAQLRIALAKERQGKPDAQALFARIAREYADQLPVSSIARARSAAMNVAGARRGQALPRRVLDGGYGYLSDISADGRVAVGMERAGYSSNSIIARDLESGNERVIVAGTLASSGAAPRVAADGRRVAYGWVETDAGSTVTGRSLRILGLEAGAKPTVVFDDRTKWARPSDWHPDGKRLLVNLQQVSVTNDVDLEQPTELGWLSLEDKSYRVLKTFESWRSHFPERLSPDGRYIAYATEPRAGSADRYLYVLDSETHRENAIVTAAGVRESPVWSGDGAQLVYVEGTALKAVAIRDGEAAGEPRVIHSGFVGTAIAATTSGAFYFSQQVGGGNYEYILPRKPSASDRVIRFAGLSASWSRDGRYVAFFRGTSPRNLDLIVRDVETGVERSYPREGLTPDSPRWLPDGSGVIVAVNEQGEGRARPIFEHVNFQSGVFKLLFERDANGRVKTNVAALSADGKTLFLGVRSSATGPVTGIVGVDVTTGEERQVTTFAPGAGQANDVGLSISPDGDTLAVSVWTKAYATARIFTIGIDGSNYRDVLGPFDTGWIGDKLRWTPDGSSLVFAAFDASRNWRIMRVPVEGGASQFDGLDYTTLSAMLEGMRMWPGNFNNIDLSPDGSRIIVSALTFSKNELWTLDTINGSDQPQ